VDADRVALGFEHRPRVDRQLAVLSVQPSRGMARAPWPGAVSPIASYSMSSVGGEESWRLNRLRSSSPELAEAQRPLQASARALEGDESRFDIETGDRDLLGGAEHHAFCMVRAVSKSARTRAAAPSETERAVGALSAGRRRRGSCPRTRCGRTRSRKNPSGCGERVGGAFLWFLAGDAGRARTTGPP